MAENVGDEWIAKEDPKDPDEKDIQDDELKKIAKAEIVDNVGEMVKNVPLKAGSIYDFVFWELFHEDNPKTMQTLKMKLGLAFGVHILAVYYYFVNTGDFQKPIYFGGAALNIVRVIAVLLLHLSSYSSVSSAQSMLSFLIANPTKFACGSIAYPSIICVFKVFVVVCAQVAGTMFLLTLDSQEGTIKKFAIMMAIAGFDSKLLDIFQGINQDEMNSMPLEYITIKSSGQFMPKSRDFTDKVMAGRIKAGCGDIALLWFLEAFDWILGVFYNTVYFYFTPFFPIMLIIITSSIYRNAPDLLVT